MQAGERAFEGVKVSLWRWRDDFQHDFAARMDWTVKPYDKANHAPVVMADRPSAFTVKSGQGFGINARASTDPDGDSLSFFWSVYPEAGTYEGEVAINPVNGNAVWFTAPTVKSRAVIHYILKVTDKGSPPLSSYKRFVVTVEP